MKKYYIFDFDGTLVDSMPYWINMDFDLMKSCGIEPNEELHKTLWTMSVTEMAKYCIEHFNLDKSVEEITTAIYGVMTKHYIEDIKLKEGVKEVLDKLKAEGCKLGIVTLSAGKIVRACLKANNAEEYFDSIITTMDTGLSKRDDGIYLKALEDLGCKAEEAVYIDDSEYALKSGKRLGFTTIGVYEKCNVEGTNNIKEVSDYYMDTFKDWPNNL